MLMRLESDLVCILQAVNEDRLGEVEVKWSPRATVCVVMASGGYPGKIPERKRDFGAGECLGNERRARIPRRDGL